MAEILHSGRRKSATALCGTKSGSRKPEIGRLGGDEHLSPIWSLQATETSLCHRKQCMCTACDGIATRDTARRSASSTAAVATSHHDGWWRRQQCCSQTEICCSRHLMCGDTRSAVMTQTMDSVTAYRYASSTAAVATSPIMMADGNASSAARRPTRCVAMPSQAGLTHCLRWHRVILVASMSCRIATAGLFAIILISGFQHSGLPTSGYSSGTAL